VDVGHHVGRGQSLLSLSVVSDRDGVILVVAGEVDLSDAGEIEAHLEELWAAGHTTVDIDLHQVSFMDSSGLHAITRAARAARAPGTTLTIIDVSEPVRRLLGLTCMDQVLPIRSRAEAG
jgi:anti-sigma B factor antagonist